MDNFGNRMEIREISRPKRHFGEGTASAKFEGG
jgi:hypothetical protein